MGAEQQHLSLGDDTTKKFFSEQVCRHIFSQSMANFTAMEHNNFIQIYCEEAHNLFPRRDDRDLSQVYNRLAKEGAKLSIGLLYATKGGELDLVERPEEH